jgi:predicted RND superfamily exporter protein
VVGRVVLVVIGVLVACWVAFIVLVSVISHIEQSSQPAVAVLVLDRSGAEQITYSEVSYSRTTSCRSQLWLVSHHRWPLVVVGHASFFGHGQLVLRPSTPAQPPALSMTYGSCNREYRRSR